jgi:FKBP-type peptidyl-prolyl cis-trans isomerase
VPRRVWRAWAIALVLAACTSKLAFQVIEEVTFDPGLGIDLSQMTKLPSGVYIQDHVVGTGAVLAVGDSASLDLTGWLSNGVEFSSGPLTIEYGVTDTGVEGFDIGLEGMAEGGSRLMIIPPDLAYGNFPPPGGIIPRGAILVFLVDLLSIS